MTGTLTLTYRQGTPLGDLRVEGWIDRVEGIKTYAKAHIIDIHALNEQALAELIVDGAAMVGPLPRAVQDLAVVLPGPRAVAIPLALTGAGAAVVGFVLARLVKSGLAPEGEGSSKDDRA